MTPELSFALDVPPQVVIGAPFMVGVTVTNPRPERTYYTLAKITRFSVPPPVEFWVLPQGSTAEASRQVLPARLRSRAEGEPSGMTLRPHESRRFLFDVSELWPVLKAGSWTLGGRYLSGCVPAAEAQPAPFEAVAPLVEVAEALARLRGRHEAGSEPSWNATLLANFREIEETELEELDASASAALAMHLWLHRALHGPTRVSDIDPAGLDAFATGVLEGEAEVLRHELLVGRADPAASTQAASVLASWPALAWRIDGNNDGQGMLTVLRQGLGAERPSPPVPDPLPYTP